MASLLLIVIYMAFVSLGLPDSLLGSAWPVMRNELNVPLSFAGIISMIIAGGTIVSSLLSDCLTKKWGAGLITAVSVLMTAVALFGFSVAKTFVVICICAVPYGLGAGAVDAALNNYVALHYSSRHMSWLHACWGVGVSISPYIMSYCLGAKLGWEKGYLSVAVMQCVLTVIIFASLPFWKKSVQSGEIAGNITFMQVIRVKGVVLCLIAFLCFCAFESTTGLWAATYLTDFRNINATVAAKFATLFFSGITAGRILSGFIVDKIGDKNMMRIGLSIMITGIFMIMLPAKSDVFALVGLVITGLGSAPVYPCIIHSTPSNFGRENSQALVGIQMASAYVGSTFMPPIFGVIAQKISIGLYPVYLAVFAIIVFVMLEIMNSKIKKD